MERKGNSILITLPDSICFFIRELCTKYSKISEMWWLGSRANDFNVRPGSDWDFLAFAGESAFSKISLDKELEKNAIKLGIDLLVEKENGIFRSVWGAAKSLKLKDDLKWQAISEAKAKYWASKLIERQPEDQLFQDEWQKEFVEHGADAFSQDVSTWMCAKRVWPPT